MRRVFFANLFDRVRLEVWSFCILLLANFLEHWDWGISEFAFHKFWLFRSLVWCQDLSIVILINMYQCVLIYSSNVWFFHYCIGFLKTNLKFSTNATCTSQSKSRDDTVVYPIHKKYSSAERQVLLTIFLLPPTKPKLSVFVRWTYVQSIWLIFCGQL